MSEFKLELIIKAGTPNISASPYLFRANGTLPLHIAYRHKCLAREARPPTPRPT